MPACFSGSSDYQPFFPPRPARVACLWSPLLLHRMSCPQLYWPSARVFYAATVEAEDATRAPHIKCVRYKRDAVTEWGHFLDGQFHTETGAVRTAHIKKAAKPAVAVSDKDPGEARVSNGTTAGANAAAGTATQPDAQESLQQRIVTEAPVPDEAQQSTAADVETAGDGADGSPAKRRRHEPLAAHEPSAGAARRTGVHALLPKGSPRRGCVCCHPMCDAAH